jgi:hypothetical protein
MEYGSVQGEKVQDVAADLVGGTAISRVELAEHSLLYFIITYLTAAQSAFAEVHYELAEHLQTPTIYGHPKRILSLFPREHAKTTLVTFAFVLWCVVYNKKSNIVLVSDTAVQAKEFLRNIKIELSNNELLKNDFGDLVPKARRSAQEKWDETHIITTNQVQIKVFSPGVQLRGIQRNVVVTDEQGVVSTQIQRPDLIILDDILKDQFVRSREQRDDLYKWFFNVMFNAADSNVGDIIVIGTISSP